MATGAADGMIRSVFEGCISAFDIEIERRPYHRNCSCALHKSGGRCDKSAKWNKKISYPIRRSWSESCLVLSVSNCCSSPSSSPANVLVGMEKTQLELCKEEKIDS